MLKLKIINPVARALIMRKGGAHVKTQSSQRAQVKKEIKKVLDNLNK
jgi:hypothetical protein